MKKRLDSYLVEKNFFESRAKAQVHILAGEVYVNNEKVLVPSKLIREPSDIEVKFLSDNYVSRSGIKLKSALDNFNVSTLDISVQKLNNDTYLKIFDQNATNEKVKPTNNDLLTSGIKLNLQNNKFNLETGIISYENLQKANSDRYEFILPY